MSAGANFYIKPQDGEHIETTVSLMPETQAAIHGVVVDGAGAAISEAIVMLFTSGTGGKKLIGRQFTDKDGQFCFGPIDGGVLHQIKIYKNDVKLRELEIVAEGT